MSIAGNTHFLTFHTTIIPSLHFRLVCFVGDISVIIIWMTLTFFIGLFGRADVALLIEYFNVALLLNAGVEEGGPDVEEFGISDVTL